MKQARPILVVIGNPPYNAFAGTSPAEETGMIGPYKEGLQSQWGIRKFNLDDLYVRFFRVAERRIAESTGRGVVCFISNHSWLWYPSFVVMRQRLLNEFSRFWIDNLNGSKFETGKVAPDGGPDPSVFSTETNREGIQVGTAITLLVKSSAPGTRILYRDLWGPTKRQELVTGLSGNDHDSLYTSSSPAASNRFSLRFESAAIDYTSWPFVSDLSELPPFSGALEMRRGRLMSLDKDELLKRMRRYFNPALALSEVRETGDGPVLDMARFNSALAREKLLQKEAFTPAALRQIALYPFETRWAYHTNSRPLWNEPRPELAARVFHGNSFLVTRFRARRPDEGVPMFWTPLLPGYHLLDPNAHPLPVFDNASRANLSAMARNWLSALGLNDPDVGPATAALPWHHALAIGYAPAWLTENADGIRQDWPRIPLPGTVALLRASASLGQRVAALLDPDTPVPGVTAGEVSPALATIAVPSKLGGGNMAESDRALTAGWGHAGKDGAIMPGRGRRTTRPYNPQTEAAAHAEAATLGEHTSDIYLNQNTYWRNVPEQVWQTTIGGYQVMKKFLSYRERPILGRVLTPGEIRHVRDMARRLAAIRLLSPDLDANYRARAAAHISPQARPGSDEA